VRLTDEQEALVESFETGEDIAVEAGAGTGKSTSLKILAERNLDLSGILLSFNSSIAEDARSKLPGTTACMTSHSLAMRSGGADRFRERIDAGSMSSKEIANHLGIRRYFRGAKGRKDLSQGNQAYVAMETVRRFCQSDDVEIKPQHVPNVIQVERHRQSDLARVIMPYAREIWSDVSSEQPQLALGQKHLDHALKLYVMGEFSKNSEGERVMPVLPFDFAMLDEAQDTNRVLAGFMERQSSSDVQVIVVGDSSQQMYAWRGADDFLSRFPAKHRLTLSQSFRFGDAVAEEANNWLRYLDAPIRLRGLPSIDSTTGHVQNPAAVLCRTNAEVVEQAMRAQAAGVDVALIGKNTASAIASFALAAQDLKQGMRPSSYHHELSVFERWADVVAYVAEENPGGSFGTYVRLIERYGPSRVLEVADACVDQRTAQMVVGTCHSAKGLEFDSVLVDPGVVPGDPSEVEGDDKDAKRICYVAVTRAKYQLDATGLSGYHKRHKSIVRQRIERAMAVA
jgi:superfamily I DNA/RNA helicase